MIPNQGRFVAVLWHSLLLLSGLYFESSSIAQAQARELLPTLPAQVLSNNQWLQLEPSKATHSVRLRPCLPGVTPPTTTIFQWVKINPARPATITCRARAGTALFIDNRLILQAHRADIYRLNLDRTVTRSGWHLIACWFSPSLGQVTNALIIISQPAVVSRVSSISHTIERRSDLDPNRDVFILGLLGIGLLFGALRVMYRFSLSRFLRFQMVAAVRSEEARSGGVTLFTTPLTILLIFAFLVSFSLFVTMIHTRLENDLISRYLFTLSDLDVTLRVSFYVLLGLIFIAVRYVYLYVIGYVFDLSAVVAVHYREFLRTLLFAGLYLPLMIVLHLTLEPLAPRFVFLLSNGVIVLLLAALIVRTIRAVRQQQALLNLQLFSYLCATEVIPLTVLLKLIVFPYV